jgi:hypothetical protein
MAKIGTKVLVNPPEKKGIVIRQDAWLNSPLRARRREMHVSDALSSLAEPVWCLHL